MIETNKVYCMDAFELLKQLPDNSVNLVLTDPPYGITSNEWDNEFSLEEFWNQIKRVLKEEGCAVITSCQPFTSKITLSNLEMFKHEWVWIKNRGSNFANTKREPFKEHENIVVFGFKKWTYNPQMQERTGGGLSRVQYELNWKSKSENYLEFSDRLGQKRPNLRVPSSWQKFNVDNGLHPTQKPLALFEYMVRTYSNENDLIIDCFVGSGTTAVACKKLGRNFICCDNNPDYVEIANKRLVQQSVTDFTSDSKNPTFVSQKEFNMGDKVSATPTPKEATLPSHHPNIIRNFCLRKNLKSP